MKTQAMKYNLSLITALVALFLLMTACWAGEVTIIGEVNDTHQIVADKQIYEVDENPLGDDLVYNYISERVKVTGFISEKDDMKIITVTRFEVVPE